MFVYLDGLKVEDLTAAEFEGREVALSEKTWAGQVLRSGDSYLLDHVAGPGGPAPKALLVPAVARNIGP